MTKVVPVILCGGAGTRLWPLSRAKYPKQFVEFEKGENLFKTTVARARKLVHCKPIIVCNEAHKYYAQRNLNELSQESQIIVEPFSRNTAPAIAVGALTAYESDKDAILFVMPSDHAIQGEEIFKRALKQAVNLAERNYLVTFGITPNKPETGYGYIQGGDSIDNLGFKVEKFIEKPKRENAEGMINQGGYYWNSGMFVFKARVFLEEIKQFNPSIYNCCYEAMEGITENNGFISPKNEYYEMCPSDSIDYSVMEKTKKAAVVPLNIMWNDLGSWSSFHKVGKKDENGNVRVGDTLLLETTGSYIHSTNQIIATIGMRDVAVVADKDAVLVSSLNRVQEVKTIVKYLKEKKRNEANLPPVVHRPWGTYESLARGGCYQTKRIIVFPGQCLSLQLHHHRSEHWTIVKGTAEITLGDSVREYSKNQSIYIPVETIHRLKNNTSDNVILIEVQCGDYLGEDDIVRLEDIYNRA